MLNLTVIITKQARQINNSQKIAKKRLVPLCLFLSFGLLLLPTYGLAQEEILPSESDVINSIAEAKRYDPNSVQADRILPIEPDATSISPIPVASDSLNENGNFRSRRNARRRLNRYLDEIKKIEIESGAYSNQLSEQLSGLGKVYQDIGQHDEAIEAFKRSAHISRINDGLYSLNQVPIVENMAESFVRRGQWKDASESKQYLLWLYHKNYEDGDQRLLPAINSLSHWFLSYHAMHYNSSTINLVSLADGMFKNSLRIIRDNYGDTDIRSADAYKGLIQTNWYFRTMPTIPGLEYINSEFETIPSNDLSMDPQRKQLDLVYVHRRSRREGMSAINGLIELYADNPEAPPGAEAQAIVELGDWNLLFGDRHNAIDAYKEAQQKLSSNEHEEVRSQVNKLFGRPVALPNLPLLESIAGLESPEQPSSGYVVAQFDVSKQGDVRNISILESMPENDISQRRKAKMSLSRVKFRPRFVNGEPVYTEHMIHRYVFNN